MRFSNTYLLRLYVDTDESERICGNLFPVSKKQVFSFKNANELIALLQRSFCLPPKTLSPHKNEDSGEIWENQDRK